MTTPAPPLLDELLGLLDDSAPNEAATAGQDLHMPAPLDSDMPQVGDDAPLPAARPGPTAEVVDLDAVRRKRAKRQALIDTAVEVSAAFLDTIREAQQAGATDFDDAIKGLPVVHRLIEHAERNEAARRDGAGMPTIHISIGRADGRRGIGIEVRKPEIIDVPSRPSDE